jgi:hypothetical protein
MTISVQSEENAATKNPRAPGRGHARAREILS